MLDVLFMVVMMMLWRSLELIEFGKLDPSKSDTVIFICFGIYLFLTRDR